MHANIAGQNGSKPFPSLGVVHTLLAPLSASFDCVIGRYVNIRRVYSNQFAPLRNLQK